MWDVEVKYRYVHRRIHYDFRRVWRPVKTPSGRWMTKNNARAEAERLNAAERIEYAGKAPHIMAGRLCGTVTMEPEALP
jgi:hypothetical protein